MELFLVFFSDAIRVVLVKLHLLIVRMCLFLGACLEESMPGEAEDYLSPRTRTAQTGLAVFPLRWLFCVITFSWPASHLAAT